MDGVTTISVQRLKELEAKAAKIDERNKKDIEKLKKYAEENPKAAQERAKRYKEKNRDAYNARRRELYRMKKEAAAKSSTLENPPGDRGSTA